MGITAVLPELGLLPGGAVACRGSSDVIIEYTTMITNMSVSGTCVPCEESSTAMANATIMAFGARGTAVLCRTGDPFLLRRVQQRVR